MYFWKLGLMLVIGGRWHWYHRHYQWCDVVFIATVSFVIVRGCGVNDRTDIVAAVVWVPPWVETIAQGVWVSVSVFCGGWWHIWWLESFAMVVGWNVCFGGMLSWCRKVALWLSVDSVATVVVVAGKLPTSYWRLGSLFGWRWYPPSFSFLSAIKWIWVIIKFLEQNQKKKEEKVGRSRRNKN